MKQAITPQHRPPPRYHQDAGAEVVTFNLRKTQWTIHKYMCTDQLFFSRAGARAKHHVIITTAQMRRGRSGDHVYKYDSANAPWTSAVQQINRNCELLIFYVIYETLGRVFNHISKHREVCWKNEAQPSFFNTLRGVWICDETLLHLKQIKKF